MADDVGINFGEYITPVQTHYSKTNFGPYSDVDEDNFSRSIDRDMFRKWNFNNPLREQREQEYEAREKQRQINQNALKQRREQEAQRRKQQQDDYNQQFNEFNESNRQLREALEKETVHAQRLEDQVDEYAARIEELESIVQEERAHNHERIQKYVDKLNELHQLQATRENEFQRNRHVENQNRRRQSENERAQTILLRRELKEAKEDRDEMEKELNNLRQILENVQKTRQEYIDRDGPDGRGNYNPGVNSEIIGIAETILHYDENGNFVRNELDWGTLINLKPLKLSREERKHYEIFINILHDNVPLLEEIHYNIDEGKYDQSYDPEDLLTCWDNAMYVYYICEIVAIKYNNYHGTNYKACSGLDSDTFRSFEYETKIVRTKGYFNELVHAIDIFNKILRDNNDLTNEIFMHLGDLFEYMYGDIDGTPNYNPND